jgi:hypothetical protein
MRQLRFSVALQWGDLVWCGTGSADLDATLLMLLLSCRGT